MRIPHALRPQVMVQLPQLKGIQVMGLHGQMVQKKRDKTLERFESGDAGVLVCTGLLHLPI